MGSPPRCGCQCGGHLTSTQLPRTCTGSSSASSPGAEPSGCKAQGQAQRGSVMCRRPPCPTQPHAAHLRDGVEGGLRLALPAPALAEGCTEGCGDAGGEAQVQLQPPGAHRDVPGSLCRHHRERGDHRMPQEMRGARDPRDGLCSAQGCPPPTELTWTVGTLHMAAVPIGELGGAGVSRGAG